MYILSVAGLLTGCSSDDVTEIVDDTPQKIAFKVSDNWQQGTRTLANSSSDLEAKSFVVLGRYDSGDAYSEGTNIVFNNQEVSYTADGWDYSPKQNWEKSSTYRFCAFWPKTDGATLTGDLATTISINNFTIDKDLANQADLLISDVPQQVVDDNPRQMSEQEGNLVHDGITLKFRHILANIRFQVAKTKGTKAEIKVTNVRLYNVKNTSSFTTTSSDNGETWSDGTWQQPTGSVVYNSGTMNVDVAIAEYNSATGNWDWDTTVHDGLLGDGFVMIPQTVNKTNVADADRVYVIIEYSSTPENGTSTVRRVTSDLPISDAGQVWQMNKRVTYRLMINEDNVIKFGKPSVESWGTAQASGTIIIK